MTREPQVIYEDALQEIKSVFDPREHLPNLMRGQLQAIKKICDHALNETDYDD